MKTISETNVNFLQAVRAMNPGCDDAKLCIRNLTFAEVYCSIHPDFAAVRKLFWEEMTTATVSTYTNESVFSLRTNCWVRMCDGTGNINSHFCHIADNKADACSIMGCQDFATFQQALGYLLARFW